MKESQRLTWVLSNPTCAEVNNALQDYTPVRYSTSDQHEDLSPARKKRDTDDTERIMAFLSSKSPFDDDPTLHSIDTGVTASVSVNADNAESVGKKILDEMAGQKVLEYAFKKKNQFVTLG